ncbi:t-SNARE [Phellopilus nigrolimitatus]|nr:t-SNARE [Phellopilus nigrolimitatus]
MAAASSSTSTTPTTRSRTLLFISYRDSTTRTTRTNPYLPSSHNYADSDAFNGDDEHEHLIPASHNDPSSSSRHLALDVDLPPKWVDISDQVHDILAGTQSKISALERLHAKHVLPGFTDRSAEEREIEAVTTEITRDFRRCQALIQNISASPPHAFPPGRAGPSRHESLAAQNVQRGLAAQVQELSATFRKKQRVYMETLQGHAIKNQDLLVASGAVSLKGPEGMSDLDEDVRVATRGQQSSMLEVEDAPDLDLQQRDREITEIAKSIASLAELFKDLSTLVIDQGTLLDSVEYNIEQTSVHMAEAVTELNIAERCVPLLLITFRTFPFHTPSFLPPFLRSVLTLSQPATPAQLNAAHAPLLARPLASRLLLRLPVLLLSSPYAFPPAGTRRTQGGGSASSCWCSSSSGLSSRSSSSRAGTRPRRRPIRCRRCRWCLRTWGGSM